MNQSSHLACVLLATALVGSQDGRTAGGPSPALVKAGFDLDAAALTALSGYKVRADSPLPSASAAIAGRRFHASNGSHRLFLQVAVSQRSPDAQTPEALLREWLADDSTVSVPFEAIWTETRHVGDASFLHPLAPEGEVAIALAFVRSNVLVQIWESSKLVRNPSGGLSGVDGFANLLPLAKEIDATIQSLPSVTFEKLQDERPQIDTFSVASNEAAPNAEVPVTFKVSYPSGRPESPWFSYGIVETEGGLVFKHEEVGLHKERVVAIDQRLLHAEATIQVRVSQ